MKVIEIIILGKEGIMVVWIRWPQRLIYFNARLPAGKLFRKGYICTIEVKLHLIKNKFLKIKIKSWDYCSMKYGVFAHLTQVPWLHVHLKRYTDKRITK